MIECSSVRMQQFLSILIFFVFPEFIHGISQFSVKGDKESKLKFAFRLYDMDKDGYISNGELFQVINNPLIRFILQLVKH